MAERGGAWRILAERDGAWRILAARGSMWRHVERVINRTETLSDAWGHVRSPTTLRLSRFCRSARDDLCGSFKTAIGAMFVAVMRAVVVYAV